MKFQIKKAEQSVILTVFIQDSSSTTGAGLGSLTQASSIVGGYVKRNGTGVALAVDEDVTTEGTYQAPSAAGKVRIGTPANMRTGVYELHFHNDLFTTADWVTISLGGASNMAELLIEIQLTDLDLNTASVAQGADNNTILSSLTIANGAVDAKVTYIMDAILTEGGAGRLAAAFIKLLDVATPLLVASDVMVGTDSAALASVLGAAVGASISADIADIPTVAEFNARSIVSADYTIVSDLGTVQSGDSFARIGVAGAGLSDITVNAASVTAIWAKAMSDLAQGAPSATASVLVAINYLYEAWRNKTLTTATLITVMKDNGTTGLVKSTISDDSTTFTKAEFISGA